MYDDDDDDDYDDAISMVVTLMIRVIEGDVTLIDVRYLTIFSSRKKNVGMNIDDDVEKFC